MELRERLFTSLVSRRKSARLQAGKGTALPAGLGQFPADYPAPSRLAGSGAAPDLPVFTPTLNPGRRCRLENYPRA